MIVEYNTWFEDYVDREQLAAHIKKLTSLHIDSYGLMALLNRCDELGIDYEFGGRVLAFTDLEPVHVVDIKETKMTEEKSCLGEIKLHKQMKYGNALYYVDNELAKKFADLLGRKTLTGADLERLSDIGFKIVIRGDETIVISKE